MNSFIKHTTAVPTKSDSDVILCLQLLKLNTNVYTSIELRQLIDHLCFIPILRYD